MIGLDILLDKIQSTLYKDVRMKTVNGRSAYSSRNTYFGGRELIEESLHINYLSISNGLFRPVKNINITLIRGSDDIIIEKTNDEINFRKRFKYDDFKKIIGFINSLIIADTKINYEMEIRVL